jgi:poly[(R)-3-hydroxyalkanoate] polymerase subunit PhaC
MQDWGKEIDPFGIAESVMAVQSAWLKQPELLAVKVQELTDGGYGLYQHLTNRISGAASEAIAPAVKYDERFLEHIWTENPGFDLLKESYLLYSRWLEDTIFDTPDLDDKARRKAAYWVRQGLNAMSPTNYFWTNPLAQWKFVTSGGQSLVDGFRLWSEDISNNDVSMVNTEQFKVGDNIAATPGQVVFRNELLEIIQYEPVTEKVNEMPLLIISPWINRYYILDLAPGNSLVEFLVGKGFTVFISSWKNPTREMRDTTFEDYMFKGALAAVEAVKEISGSKQIHAVGYCIGGTLLATLMAWINKKNKKDSPIAHWTLFASLLDFSKPGDIDVFIDEKAVDWLEKKMDKEGYLDGNDMGRSFRMLRSNSLIWRYVVHSYLYGEEPAPLDVLFWNTDCTRLPAAMHSFYLREFYLKNSLIEPDAMKFNGRSIDLGCITQPLYAVGTEQDHIAPWKETFKIASLTKSPVRYTLATSGHIMGIINPPAADSNRRYWSADATGHDDADDWCQTTVKQPGSWWDDWSQWLDEHCGKEVEPHAMGCKRYPVLEAAPGSYVLEK